jgi:prepilin-type N-terminal cleavage/methylation domain-containing protein
MQAKKAFTLVELIVVITILAILATISFITLQGFTSQARDTKRISDIRNLISKITIEHTKWASYEDLIVTQKTNSWFTINWLPATSHQWPANFTNLKENPNKFKDPLTGKNYIFSYTVWNWYDFLQWATISEQNDNNAVVLWNYYQTSLGDIDWLIFDENDEPLINWEYWEIPPNQWWNDDDDNSITDLNNCTSTWQILSATSRYTNKDWIEHNGWVQCDTNDIIVCTGNWTWITLAACNVWAKYATSEACENSSYTGSLDWWDNWNCITDKMWLHFQWWSSTGYKFENTYTLSTSYDYAVDSWLTQSSASTSDRWNQWPCPSWYHIPSPDEWYSVIEAWNWGGGWTLWSPSDSTSYYRPTNSYRSLTSWWSDIRTALKLPAAGRRYSSGGLNHQGTGGLYWSSMSHASTASHARYLYFSSSLVYPGGNDYRYDGFSVRCFKN